MLIYIHKTVLDTLQQNEKYREIIDKALMQIVRASNNHRHIMWGNATTLKGLLEHYKQLLKDKQEYLYKEGKSLTEELLHLEYETLHLYLGLYNGFNAIHRLRSEYGKKLNELANSHFHVNVVFVDNEKDNSSKKNKCRKIIESKMKVPDTETVECKNIIDVNRININIYTCPNKNFDFFCHPTMLLLENNDDYNIYYKKIALKYMDKNKFDSKYFSLKCEQKQTGGSAVQSAIETELSEMSHFIFGLTDSDKDIDEDDSDKDIDDYDSDMDIEENDFDKDINKSKTCYHFKVIKNRKDNFLYDCHTLIVRDIENLISLKMLLDYVNKYEKEVEKVDNDAEKNISKKRIREIKTNIEKIISLIKNEEKREKKLYKHFDYENGIRDNKNDITAAFRDTAKDMVNSNICNNNELKQILKQEEIQYGELPCIIRQEWEKVSIAFFKSCCKDIPKGNTQLWKEAFELTDSNLPINGVSKKDEMKKIFNKFSRIEGYDELPTILKDEWKEVGKLIFSRCCTLSDNRRVR